MRLDDGRRSENVEDRRGVRVSRTAVGGGIGTVLLVIVALYLGVDPRVLLTEAPTDGRRPGETATEGRPAEENRLADFVSAVRAASAIGDDRLQRQSRGVVVPDSFTHGTSEQRVRWFRRGLETGDVNRCDTFQAAQL